MMLNRPDEWNGSIYFIYLHGQEIKSSSCNIRFGATSEWKWNNNVFGERTLMEKHQAQALPSLISVLFPCDELSFDNNHKIKGTDVDH